MKRLLVIALIMCITQLQAQVRIGEAEAYSTAEQFVTQQGRQGKPTLTLSEEIKSERSGPTNLFVFSMEPKGYVIVSALNDVLAYSFESSMPAIDERPDHIRYWLNLYNERTDYLVEHPEQRKEPTRSQTAVEPLLTSCWGQGCYHNAACPVDSTGPCQHVEAGCVAIAMAQIMYYNKFPTKGTGSMTYYCSPYGTLTADFENTYYNWDDMVDTLSMENPAVATLVSHCGISVKMQYSSNGSGAHSQDVPNALHCYFTYPFASYAKRDSYNDEEWLRTIKNDLDRLFPVYYSGNSSVLSQHAFVCDGYDNNGLFHFNFGWDGFADGYYTIDYPYGYSDYQSIIHYIYPIDEIPIHSDNHGIIYVANNGTGDGSSWTQATSELQLAIFKSKIDNNSIWVKEGTYTGNPTNGYALNISGDCHLYGGFNGDEPYNYDLSLRNFETHPSVLDGNHMCGVINVSTESSNSPILIDGFTIQNGNAQKGGGILTNNDIHIKNCKFLYNHAVTNGGAFSNNTGQYYSYSESNTLMEYCEFYGNDTKGNGGAVYDAENSTYLCCQFRDNISKKKGGAILTGPYTVFYFINCSISNNTAKEGGGIYNMNDAKYWNCLINNNTAETGGGVYCSGYRPPYLFNCTIVKNEAQNNYGGIYANEGIYADGGSIQNCIIWGNTSQGLVPQIGPINSYNNCAVQNDPSGSELNFNAAEENDGELSSFYIRFKDPNVIAGCEGRDGDWRLQPNSLCVDKGVIIPDQPETDLDGNTRIWNGAIDLGAYEYSITTSIGELNGDDKTFLFPNPANDIVTIYSTSVDKVVVYNLFGECIAKIKAGRKAITLDVSHYANGIYIIQISQLNKHHYKKFMVRH